MSRHNDTPKDTSPSLSTLIHFSASAGDHNNRALVATDTLVSELSQALHVLFPTAIRDPASHIEPAPGKLATWQAKLAAATSALRQLAQDVDSALASSSLTVTATSRCAASLATLPVVVRAHPDVAVVWLDAHPDMNTPETSASGHLGGMALAGAMGMWDSGLGSGLDASAVVLAGTRSFDDSERAAIDAHGIKVVPPGDGFAAHLAEAVGGRAVYVHLDCDVLDPSEGVAAGSCVPGGLTLTELREAMAVLAVGSRVVGVEVAEFEYADDVPAAEVEATMMVAARKVVGAMAPVLLPRVGPCV